MWPATWSPRSRRSPATRAFFTSKVSQIILDPYVGKSDVPENVADPDSPLTPREREVVQLLAEGKSSTEVAAVLGISVKTDSGSMAGSVRKSGAHGYVVKSRAAQDLVQALERLLRGGTFFDSGMYAH